jgi:hypothetical protein
MSFIYIASPYTSPDPEVVQQRFEVAEAYTHYLLKNEFWAYSPVVHCHEIAHKFSLPKNFDYWMNYNFAMLSKASDLHVLKIPGFEESKGVAGEVEFAKKCGISVIYVDPYKYIK